MFRYVVEWSGPSIEGLAVSVLHFMPGAPPAPADIQSAFLNLATAIPTNVVLTFPTGGDEIDETTGQLVGGWSSGAAPAPVSGVNSPNAAAGVGACVTWNTGAVVGGRRVRGRTFIVPMEAGMYEPDGTINAQPLSNLVTFSTGLIALGLAVWHRPTGPGASDGSSHAVTSAKISDRVAVLRSRRF